jgi:Skp family chaperone for outer membrane proteins
MLRAILIIFAAISLCAQSHDYGDARTLVDRVQNDLKRAADFERRKGKETERYENAQKHLSEFDRELHKGKFDKDKLDASIDDVKNVVEHNTLNPEDRDALSADLRALRQMREDRGKRSELRKQRHS